MIRSQTAFLRVLSLCGLPPKLITHVNRAKEVVPPPPVSSSVASLIGWSLKADLLAEHMVARLAVVTITYGIVFVVVIRLIFWHSLAKLLSYVPGGPHLRRVLLVPVVTAFTVGPSQ